MAVRGRSTAQSLKYKEGNGKEARIFFLCAAKKMKNLLFGHGDEPWCHVMNGRNSKTGTSEY
jgi:hypothetical protein